MEKVFGGNADEVRDSVLYALQPQRHRFVGLLQGIHDQVRLLSVMHQVKDNCGQHKGVATVADAPEPVRKVVLCGSFDSREAHIHCAQGSLGQVGRLSRSLQEVLQGCPHRLPRVQGSVPGHSQASQLSISELAVAE
eukprot:11228284-Lingulodinium_polyedra.AAC.1